MVSRRFPLFVLFFSNKYLVLYSVLSAPQLERTTFTQSTHIVPYFQYNKGGIRNDVGGAGKQARETYVNVCF